MKTTKKWRLAMKKMIFVGKFVVIFIGLSVLLASMSFGADTAETKPNRGTLAFNLRAGLASITAEGYGSSFSYGGGLFMHLSQRLGLEIILDRYSVPVSEDLAGMGTGKLQVTPLLVNGQWRFPMGRFVPYTSLGAGFYFINFEPDLQAQPLADHEDHEVQVVADRFALHFGGGVDVKVTRNLDIFADLRYSLIKTWVQGRDEHHVRPENQDLFKLNTLVLALGIRYYF
jgi:opacity protein-like surface antigen